MNEMRLPESVPNPPASPRSQALNEGSIGLGIGLAWAVVLGGHLLTGIVLAGVASLSRSLASILLMLLGVAPEVAVIIWGIVLITRGKQRTGLGMFLGLASMVAVVLLLVAACFGLVFFAGL